MLAALSLRDGLKSAVLQGGLRAAAPPRLKELVEVFWASFYDASWAPIG